MALHWKFKSNLCSRCSGYFLRFGLDFFFYSGLAIFYVMFPLVFHFADSRNVTSSPLWYLLHGPENTVQSLAPQLKVCSWCCFHLLEIHSYRSFLCIFFFSCSRNASRFSTTGKRLKELLMTFICNWHFEIMGQLLNHFTFLHPTPAP